MSLPLKKNLHVGSTIDAGGEDGGCELGRHGSLVPGIRTYVTAEGLFLLCPAGVDSSRGLNCFRMVEDAGIV